MRYWMDVVVDGIHRQTYRSVSPFRVLREMHMAASWKVVKWDVFVEPYPEEGA